MDTFAKLAYDAYCKSAGGVSLISGDKLPPFEDLIPEIKRAWEAAALAVIKAGNPESLREDIKT